ncbi:MAG: isochorismatase family protein [Clostridiales bacterium]|jgi:nicotinamidase-related amidase|nr:isochorismatase family protein [Clostridiales bacterium]
MTDNQLTALQCMKIAYENKPSLLLRGYNNKRACVVVIDMVEGFCGRGALFSPRFPALADRIASTLDFLPDALKVFLNDRHPADAAEFKFFPPHCHTKAECAVVRPLAPYVDRTVCKNSTNGIFAFATDADINGFDSFLIMGVCSDLCVLQFALSLRAYFNERNRSPNVLVFTDYTDTYDGSGHDAGLSNIFAFKNMEDCGIQIFKDLK